MTTPTRSQATASSTRTVKSSMTGLDSRVSAAPRIWASRSSVDLALDLELEPLALPDGGDAVEAEAGQRLRDGLALRVEDLGLEHDVDDDAGHPGTPASSAGRYAAAYRPGETEADGARTTETVHRGTHGVPTIWRMTPRLSRRTLACLVAVAALGTACAPGATTTRPAPPRAPRRPARPARASTPARGTGWRPSTPAP